VGSSTSSEKQMGHERRGGVVRLFSPCCEFDAERRGLVLLFRSVAAAAVVDSIIDRDTSFENSVLIRASWSRGGRGARRIGGILADTAADERLRPIGLDSRPSFWKEVTRRSMS
jgi:hypothetical protein